MTRRMQYFDRAVAQVKNLAVDRLMNGKIRLGMRTIYDRGAGSLGQIKMAAYKISMKMGFENILDRRLPLPGKIQINIDIPQRVDDRRFTFTLNIICRFTETSGIQLLDEHNPAFAAKLVNSCAGANSTVLINQFINAFHDLAKTVMIDNVVDELAVALGLDDTRPAQYGKMLRSN